MFKDEGALRPLALVIGCDWTFACSGTETGTENGAETDTETGIEQVCGNGVLEPDAACDGDQLDGQTCITFGHLGAQRIDDSDCSVRSPYCSLGECEAGNFDDDCDLAPFCVDHHCIVA